MNEYQIDLLASIQRMAISGSQQTGHMIRHETHSWDNGDFWSTVQVYDHLSNQIFKSVSILRNGDDAIPDYEVGLPGSERRHTLHEQHQLLTDFVANNRKQVAA